MIRFENQLFHLRTKNTSYIFDVTKTNHLRHIHYGSEIEVTKESAQAITIETPVLRGCTLEYQEEIPGFSLDNILLEVSTRGKGDTREPMVKLVNGDYSLTNDFLYVSHVIRKKEPLKTLPSAYHEEEEGNQLVITLEDPHNQVILELSYATFYETDVITRSATLINQGETPILVEQLLSAQVDFYDNDYTFTTFNGAWAREMNQHTTPLSPGKVVNGANTGTSSNRANPFVMLGRPYTTQDQGECYGFNLIYSGNHREQVEVNAYGCTRFLGGIHPEDFSYTLEPGESFEAPEATLSYGANGYNQLSDNFHRFIKEHIVRGTWKYKERPILLNSWEACYFEVNESKCLSLAKKAKELGMELFVLDDGWFGEREDDKKALGDWHVNKQKFPNGMEGLSKKINQLGMEFGIWVEPEMVNEDSHCYRAHPEWAVAIPDKPHTKGRNQYLLDLTNKDVRTYIKEEMTKVFQSGTISYVKWDMNRNMSDFHSQTLEGNRQHEFAHRYILGLYEILDHLTKAFPDILFEGCASGGNRFDLGMLSYMPQMWASDNTDAMARRTIQTGYSYGYPQSTMGAHVSSCPNHQTLRTTPLETRFQVAAFGLLGYEWNLREIGNEEAKIIKEQVEFYKRYRHTLQYGTFLRGKIGGQTPFTKGVCPWIVVNPDKTEALALVSQEMVTPNSPVLRFQARGLSPEKSYHMTNRRLKYNIKEFGDLINQVSPVHIKQNSLTQHLLSKVVKIDSEQEDIRISGSALCQVGVTLKEGFTGVGYNENIRMFKDFDSRLYVIKEVE